MLAKVPVNTLITSDDVAVSARLENLEKCMKVLTETVNKVAAPLSSGAKAGKSRCPISSEN